MTPYEQIREKYRMNPQELPFSFYENWHKQNGFYFCTPDFFAMGRTANKSALEDFGPRLEPEDDPDTWYIHAMAGDMSKAWSILPYRLPWIAFERMEAGKRRLAIHRTQDLERLSRHTPINESQSVLASA